MAYFDDCQMSNLFSGGGMELITFTTVKDYESQNSLLIGQHTQWFEAFIFKSLN